MRARAELNRQKHTDFSLYNYLSEDIWYEDRCPKGRKCYDGTWYTSTIKQGKDPRAELVRIARDVRIDPPDPWFLIGKIIVDDSALDDKSRRLRNVLKDAREEYRTKSETVEMRRQQLVEAEKQWESRVSQLRKEPEALIRKLGELNARNRTDPEKVAKSEKYANLSERVEKTRSRINEIDERISCLFESAEPGDNFNTNRMKALRAEQDALHSEVDEIATAQDDMLDPQRSDGERREIDAVANELNVVRRDADRRVNIENGKLQSSKKLFSNAELAFGPAETAMIAADKSLREFLAEKKHAVSGLLTADADIDLVGQKGAKAIADVNALIKQQERTTQTLARNREEARKFMVETAGVVEAAAEKLLHAGYGSLLVQGLVEAADAAHSLKKASAAGPVGMLIDAKRQLYLNLIFPPNYADPSGGKLEDYFKTGRPGSDYGLAEIAAPKALSLPAAKSAANAAYSFANKFALKEIESLIAADALEKAFGDAARSAGSEVTEAEFSAALSELAKKGEELAKAAAKADVSSGRTGIKALTKAAFADLGKSLLRSASKAVAKQAVAELIEQPYFHRYMEAQVELSGDVYKYRLAGNAYWQSRDLLTILRGMRDAFMDVYDAESGELIRRNEAFFADPGYRFELKTKSDISVGFKADVFLGGVQLSRDTGTTGPVWTISEDAVKKFNVNMPEKLDLIIKLSG